MVGTWIHNRAEKIAEITTLKGQLQPISEFSFRLLTIRSSKIISMDPKHLDTTEWITK